MRKILIASLIVCFFGMLDGSKACAADGVKDWRGITSVDDVCRKYPERMRELLGALDLDSPGLGDVKQAFHEGSLSEACEALLRFYRNGKSGAWLRGGAVARGKTQNKAADAVCEGRLTFYGQTSLVPRRADGRLQWDYTGPTRDKEWGLGPESPILPGNASESLPGHG